MGTAKESSSVTRRQSKPSRRGAHVLIFPFMAKGHTIPLLHLSTALTQRDDLKVTLITTPANSPFYTQYLGLPRPDVHLLELPFPSFPSIPEGCESTDLLPSFDLFPAFLQATSLLEEPFRSDVLRRLRDEGDLPLCVISDFFFGWTLRVCREFGVPRLVFHGMGVFGMALSKAIFVHQPHKSCSSAPHSSDFHVQGTPDHLRLRYTDVPDMLRNVNPNDPARQFLADIGEAETNSWGTVVNSFFEMEQDYVDPLESFYGGSAKAWLVGPLAVYNFSSGGEISEYDDPCLEWLDKKQPGSVLYVSFGTQAQVQDQQLDEVAHGLAASGQEFLWAVRSPTWVSREGVEKKGRNMIHRGWARQREILEHRAVGGVLSHCGWNSVLESVAAGVPILAWPMLAEQPLNSKYVVDVLGVGVAVEGAVVGGDLVGREAVCRGVRELMGGEKGARAREKVSELGRVARDAVGKGGSSSRTLDRLLDELRGAVTAEVTTSNGGL